MQIIVQPLPRQHTGNVQSRLSICQRHKEPETIQNSRNQDACRSPHHEQLVTLEMRTRFRHGLRLAVCGGGGLAFLGAGAVEDGVFESDGVDVEDEFDESACDERGAKVGGQVMVEEELAAHEVEGEVVSGPAEEEETGAVVETRACAYYGVLVSFISKANEP